MSDREQRAADILWDTLADLGYCDARGGTEYERQFADDRRVYEFSQAAFSIVGRLIVAGDGD